MSNKRNKAHPHTIESDAPLTIAADGETGQPRLIKIDDHLINKVLSVIRERGAAEKRWDINKLEGELGERTLLALLSDNGVRVEVKRDFKSARTGNIAIEGAYNDNPSGIMATQAEWWAYILDGPGYDGEVVVLIKTDRLRKLISRLTAVSGGDGDRARMKLLPVMGLLRKI